MEPAVGPWPRRDRVLRECLAGAGPEPLVRAIEHALARDPAQRPPSARAFREELLPPLLARTVTTSALVTGSIAPPGYPSCGAPRGDGRFCTRCGLELGGAPAAAPPPGRDRSARAWHLLRHGRIEDGRALLREACALDPLDFDAQVLAAFELQRPPEDGLAAKGHREAAARMRPDSSEVASLLLIVTLGTSYRATREHLQQARRLTPRSVQGTAIAVLARLFASDLFLQTDRPVGAAVGAVLVNSVVKGAAQLLTRKHDEALATFRRGRDGAATIAATYEREFGFRFAPEEARAAARAFECDATMGEALVHVDTGCDADARAALADLAARFPECAADAQPLLEAVSA